MIWSVPLSNQMEDLHGTTRHTHLCIFQFPITNNPNVTAKQTCTVRQTVAVLAVCVNIVLSSVLFRTSVCLVI
jgi:hypothetical protein